jgi:hypothetical protein
LWGPGTCSANVLIVVGYSPKDLQGTYAEITLAATEGCQYCVAYEKNLPIYVVSRPTVLNPATLWPAAKHYD